MASNINNLNAVASTRLEQIARNSQDRPLRAAAPPAAEAPRTLDRSDRVELSAAALNAEGVRTDLVARIRAEIAAGTYETDAKLDSAAEKLVKELGV